MDSHVTLDAVETGMPETATERADARIVRWGKRVLSLNMVLSLLFLYVPILVLVVFSFNDSKLAAHWEGFTFRWYRALLSNESILSSTWASIRVAVISTVVATIIGTMTAIGMERFRFPFRKLYDGVLYLPIVNPEIVTGVSLLAFFALTLSAINSAFGLAGDSALRTGLVTVTLTHIAFNIAFVTVVVRTSLKDFNKGLEEAAQDLGANEWMTFRRITLPLIMPGIVAGALLAITLSLDNFVITFFVTGPGGTTLPIEVFGRIRRAISPEINAISTIMLGISVLLIVVSQLLQRRR
jgi:spermidine/putrescine transport system permease protein